MFVPMSLRDRTVLIVAYLGFLSAVLVKAFSSEAATTGTLIALVVLVALSIGPLVAYRSSWGWFHPLIFTSIVGLIVLVRQFSMYADGLPFHRSPLISSSELGGAVTMYVAMQCVALAAYYVGFALFGHIRAPSLRLADPRLLPQRVMVLTAVCLIALAGYVAASGGLQTVLAALFAKRSTALEGRHYLLAAFQIFLPGIWYWTAYGRKPFSSPGFLLSASAGFFGLFIATGSRAGLVYAIAVMGIIWSLRHQEFFHIRFIIAFVGFLILVTGLGAARTASQSSSLAPVSAKETVLSAISQGLGGEFAARSTTESGVIPVLAKVPHEIDYIYGSTYAAILVAPIPRALWPSKPGLAGGRVGRTFFFAPKGVPPGGIGEAYWNFGLAGVIGIFAMFGVLHRILANFLVRNRHVPAALVIFAACLVLLRDPAGTALVSAARTLVLIAIVTVYLRMTRRSERYRTVSSAA